MALDDKDRAFMKRAVEIMKKSRSEHDDRPDPSVGAVLVDREGNFVDEVARAQNRVGNHAEYYLLEKKHGGSDLEGYRLYATLEPCAGKRGGNKKPCVDWIVNARIGEVVVGIHDPHPDHRGGVKKLLDAGVGVRFFDQNLRQEIVEFNEAFLKQDFTGQSAATEFPSADLTETQEVHNASLDSFDDAAIAAYLKKRGEEFDIPSEELWSFFRASQFLSPKNIPTIAGALLFAKRPDVLLPMSILRLERDLGGTTVPHLIRAPLVLGLARVDDFFKDHMLNVVDWDGDWEGLQRAERAMYPLKALREAVVNAVAHRSYTGGTKVHVRFYSDRIEVKSPGLPVKPLTIRKLQSGKVGAFSRNPVIANALNDMGYMDERGEGINNMRIWLAELKLPAPTFSHAEGYLIVTISGKPSVPEKERALTEKERSVLAFITQEGQATRAECQDTLKLSESTTLEVLKSLLERKLVVRERRGRKFYYRLN
jgi:ATP-dependent DNA helicase RecG